MSDLHRLIERAEALGKRAGWKSSTVSLHLFNDGKRLGLLKKDKATVTVRRLEAAMAKMDELEKEFRHRT